MNGPKPKKENGAKAIVRAKVKFAATLTNRPPARAIGSWAARKLNRAAKGTGRVRVKFVGMAIGLGPRALHAMVSGDPM